MQACKNEKFVKLSKIAIHKKAIGYLGVDWIFCNMKI